MRVDSHWTFTPSPRAYTVLLWMLLGAPMIMIPCEHHAYLQSTTKRMVWNEFIISGIIDWNTGIDANTSELNNGLYAPDIYIWAMKPLNTRLMIPTGNRSLARHGIPAHCSCRLRTPTMTLSVAGSWGRQACIRNHWTKTNLDDSEIANALA